MNLVPSIISELTTPTQMPPKSSQSRLGKVARPYRSHRYPACSRCQKRRSRCTIEILGQACLLCRLNSVKCSSEYVTDDRNPVKVGFIHQSSLLSADLEGHAQVLGPVVSRDTQALENIVPDISESHDRKSLDSHAQRNKSRVYRSAVPSRRPSPSTYKPSRELANEILRQIEPCLDQIISLYFEELHICFPLLDEHYIRVRFRHRSVANATLLTNFVAYTIFYWDLSPSLKDRGRLDQDAVWQAAVATMNDDSQKSDIFAIAAAILNVAGRPSKGVVHNTGNVARVTALSHSIGLNHNCADWSLSFYEKQVRIKLWWAVVVHDRWFNFAQGTPPYIQKEHYDVPFPSLEMLIAGYECSTKHVDAAACYISLCQLTEIVGDVLPLIYHVRSSQSTAAVRQTVVKTQHDLTLWKAENTCWSFKRGAERPPKPGLANLHLSYLAVQMLLDRITWHETDTDDRDETRLLDCLTAAEDVLHFVQSLRVEEVIGFWLPYNAQHFTSAVTLLLRCALTTADHETQHRSMSAANELVDTLRHYQQTLGWDMAEIALPQAETILRKIQASLPRLTLGGIHQSPSTITTSLVSTHLPDVDVRDGAGNERSEFDFLGTNSLEDLFPEIFAEFTDSAFFERLANDTT